MTRQHFQRAHHIDRSEAFFLIREKLSSLKSKECGCSTVLLPWRVLFSELFTASAWHGALVTHSADLRRELCRRTPHATTKTLHKCFSLALMICRQKSMKTRGANATWNKKWSKSGGKTKKKCKLRRYCGFQRLLLQAQHFCIWAVSRYWIAILEWCCSKFNLNACLITMTFYNLQKVRWMLPSTNLVSSSWQRKPWHGIGYSYFFPLPRSHCKSHILWAYIPAPPTPKAERTDAKHKLLGGLSLSTPIMARCWVVALWERVSQHTKVWPPYTKKLGYKTRHYKNCSIPII